jgi:hypothetical protein
MIARFTQSVIQIFVASDLSVVFHLLADSQSDVFREIHFLSRYERDSTSSSDETLAHLICNVLSVVRYFFYQLPNGPPYAP